MSTRRTFTNQFKRQVVEHILSGSTNTAAMCRKYAIAYPVIARWKKAYSLGRLDDEPTTEEGYQERIAQFERKVGQLTMEHNVLKKVLKQTQSQQARSTYISNYLPAFGSIKRGCKTMRLPRSSYYYRPKEKTLWE